MFVCVTCIVEEKSYSHTESYKTLKHTRTIPFSLLLSLLR